jgi:hypothetical protein
MNSDMYVVVPTRRARPAAIPDINVIALPARPIGNGTDPGGSALRATRSRSLKGVFAIMAICATCLLGGNGTRPPLETTIELEQLAARVERASSIHPNTARDFARMLAMPRYDCARTACSAALQARNSAARARLATAIAMKTRPERGADASD